MAPLTLAGVGLEGGDTALSVCHRIEVPRAAHDPWIEKPKDETLSAQ